MPALGLHHHVGEPAQVVFHGANFGLTQGGKESIDAFTFTNTGAIIISTRGTFAVNTNYSGGVGSGTTISGFGEDGARRRNSDTGSSPDSSAGRSRFKVVNQLLRLVEVQ